jgi:carboxyl-terminal processing protease
MTAFLLEDDPHMTASVTRPPLSANKAVALGVFSRRLGRAAALLLLLTLSDCSHVSGPPAATASGSQLFGEAYANIAQYYIDPVTPQALALAGLRKLSSLDPSFAVEIAAGEVILRERGSERRLPAPPPHDAAAWGTLTDRALEAGLELSPALAGLAEDRLRETVIDGSLTILDRFSHYAAPTAALERRAARDGFGGIGVSLDAFDDRARIIEVVAETPAAAAGLRPQDRIAAIDGLATNAMSHDELVRRLRGPADSAVELAIDRAGAARPIMVSLRRAFIVPPTVTLTEKQGIALLRVSAFNQHTAQDLGDRLRQAHRHMGKGLRGIILDLRGNPGGLLDQSVEVASLFLDGTQVASTVGRVSDSIQSFVAPHREVERLPMAVLINGGSASAAEIVAAALQDGGRAVVVGSASYGKGTVQNVKPLPDEGELTVTWARLIAPSGYTLHEHGVVPTLCTANLPDDADGIATALARGSPTLYQARADLDEAKWRRLRDACPGQREDHDIEVAVAEKVLAEPALYSRTLRLMPAGTAPRAVTAAARTGF